MPTQIQPTASRTTMRHRTRPNGQPQEPSPKQLIKQRSAEIFPFYFDLDPVENIPRFVATLIDRRMWEKAMLQSTLITQDEWKTEDERKTESEQVSGRAITTDEETTTEEGRRLKDVRRQGAER